MKRAFIVLLMLALPQMSIEIDAQRIKDDGKKPIAKASSSTIGAYLGTSNRNGGNISKKEFDDLLKQGLTARDSAGQTYRVDGFTFGYAERNLYEDSVGNLMILTDYLTEFCPGDTLSPAVANNIFYKTKPGDTAYFEGIKVLLPSGGRAEARPMRFVLTR